MLSDLIQIHYRHPEKTPVQLMINGNHLIIDCRFRYQKKALLPDPNSGRSLADFIEESIIGFWSGDYKLDGESLDEPVQVNVVIRREQDRRAVPIRMHRLLLMPAHVISPFYRRLWGIFKTGQLESLGTNWGIQQPGGMILPTGVPSPGLAAIAAHEAGHLFGLGDAYGAIYRFYYAVPGTERYMMHSNCEVQPAEILMLLRAHETGRMQFFPRKWQTGSFFRGLCQDIKQRVDRMTARTRM